MNLKQAVANRIIKILKDKDMTQYELSQISGVPESTISTILKSSTKSLRLNTLFDLLGSLNIELSDFFNDKSFKIKNLED